MTNDAKNVTASELMTMLEQQKYRCALSGRPLTPEAVSVDHKTPVSRGGLHCLSNLHLVTPDINAAKGTMTLLEFVAMCHDVVQTHPLPSPPA